MRPEEVASPVEEEDGPPGPRPSTTEHNRAHSGRSRTATNSYEQPQSARSARADHHGGGNLHALRAPADRSGNSRRLSHRRARGTLRPRRPRARGMGRLALQPRLGRADGTGLFRSAATPPLGRRHTRAGSVLPCASTRTCSSVGLDSTIRAHHRMRSASPASRQDGRRIARMRSRPRRCSAQATRRPLTDNPITRAFFTVVSTAAVPEVMSVARMLYPVR